MNLAFSLSLSQLSEATCVDWIAFPLASRFVLYHEFINVISRQIVLHGYLDDSWLCFVCYVRQYPLAIESLKIKCHAHSTIGPIDPFSDWNTWNTRVLNLQNTSFATVTSAE